jgi:hypothetical protein
MYKNLNIAPLSIKLALVTAAVGAGFVAPAQATVISTAPAGFTPITVINGTGASINLDIDHNGSIDYTIASPSSLLAITGFLQQNVIEVPPYDFRTAAYADPSQFLSTSSMKAINSALPSGLTSATPYFEVVFADQNSVMTEGFIKATTGTTAGGVDTFTLLDYGLVTDSAAIPEPGSLALLAAGAAGIGALRRRRRAARAV